MIKQLNRTFRINESGVDWKFKSSDSCVTFSNPEGVTTQPNQFISTDIIYEDELCLDKDLVLQLELLKDGCLEVFTFAKVDPCASLNVPTPIFTRDGNRVTAKGTASGGSGSYTFSWSFTNNNLTVISQDDDEIVFDLNQNTQQVGVLLRVDDNETGCSIVTAGIVQYVEILTVNNLEFAVDCPPTALFIPFDQLLNGASNSTPDWDTFSVGLTSGGFTVTPSTDGLSIFVEQSGALSFSYSVESTNGSLSNNGLISITVPECANLGTGLTVYGMVQRLGASETVGAVKYFPTEDRIFNSDDIDWTTFQFLKAPSNGTAVLESDRRIKYTVTTVSTEGDTFEWEVKDINGNSTGRVIDVVSHEQISAPTANDVDACLDCGVTLAVDVLANDTGEIDSKSLALTVTNNNVSSIINSNGEVELTANNNVNTATLTYQVSNYAGDTATADINVQAICSGTGTDEDITCLSKAFNLIDLFDGIQGSYTITETTLAGEGDSSNNDYTTQGGSITGPTGDGAVDFTSINSGTYRFTLTASGTGACSGNTMATEVVITLNDQPSLTINSASDNGDGTFDVQFTVASTAENFEITVDTIPAIYEKGITFDNVTGVGTCTLYFRDAASSSLAIAVDGDCDSELRKIQSVTNTGGSYINSAGILV